MRSSAPFSRNFKTATFASEAGGASGALVKTLKRADARIHPRPDAAAVLQQLPAWIEDDQEIHAHKGLQMR
jgi:putative transposase